MTTVVILFINVILNPMEQSETKLRLSDVNVYSEGIVSCSVCVPKGHTIEQITRAVNRIAPTGINTWEKSEDTHFKCGILSNPCQCNEDSNREHYLFIS